MCSIPQIDPATGGDFRCAQAGCRACQDALVRAHTGLIHTILQRVEHAGVPYAELVQAGRLALWRAVLRFDPAHGAQFSTYSGRAIERALWDAVRWARRAERTYPARPPPEPWPWVSGAVRQALLATVQQLPARLQAVLTARRRAPWRPSAALGA